MSFISIDYLIFFFLVIVIESLIQTKGKNNLFNVFLLICNYFFYSFYDWKCSFLLFFVTLLTFECGKKRKKTLINFAIVLDVVVLAFFKYFNFFLNNIGFDAMNIILPIGLSFYIFESISYLVDIKRKKIEPEENFIIFANYLCFFPNIISGPISRSSNLLTQIKNDKKITIKNIEMGIQIMAIGYFKKMVIADRLSIFTDAIFFAPKAYNWYTILLAIFSYSIQIYMDFSGYSDIAIGSAKCLGYEIEKNFNFPYFSSSFTEFWRKWHITLSSWFRDYVYIPLGGNRKGKIKQLINLLIVMSLSGFWHGANWNYLIWGFVNGAILCIEKVTTKRKINLINTVINFVLISFTWLIFRINTFEKLIQIITGLFTLQSGVSHLYVWTFVYFTLTIIVTLIIKKKNNEINYLLFDLNTIKGLTLFFIELGLILCFAYANTNPFIYFQF